MASLYPENSAASFPVSASGRGLATFLSALAAAAGNYLHSEFFEPKVIRERPLTISEAYCLLWQREDTGDVEGRLVLLELLCGACGAVILDLAALGRIEIEEVKTTTIGGLPVWDRSPVKVVDPTPTKTYLDDIIFNKMVEYDKEKKGKRKTFMDWLNSDVWKWGSKTAATLTLNSLVDKGILGKEDKFVGKRYPTLNPKYEIELVEEIRKIALEGHTPDSYMRAVLSMTRTADQLFLKGGVILPKLFTKDEYSQAKKTIDRLIKFNDGYTGM